jgi:ATP-dependent protease HslVU (ClpYQ) peptidase subunit
VTAYALHTVSSRSVPHPHLFRALFFLMVLIIAGRSGRSTTIVGISTNDSVFLGADSMVGFDGASARGSMCKINVGNNSAAAMAGHLADSATSFDAATLVRRALGTPGDLARKAQTFEQFVRQPLQQSLDYGREHVPILFASKYGGKKALETIFAIVEGGKPKMIISTFRVAENGSLTLDGAKELGSGQVYVIGESAAIAKYQTGNPGWNRTEPDEIIRKFLALEIEDEPSLVGSAVSIVRITSGKWRWIEPGQCAASGSH